MKTKRVTCQGSTVPSLSNDRRHRWSEEVVMSSMSYFEQRNSQKNTTERWPTTDVDRALLSNDNDEVEDR